MRRVVPAVVLGLAALGVGLAVSETAVPPPLSDALTAHLAAEAFRAVTAVAGLPPAVREGLRRVFGEETLGLADRGQEFQSGDVIRKPGLPWRRLLVAGCSADHCLVYYAHGGYNYRHFLVVFKVTEGAAEFEWGGVAPGGLKTAEDLREALVAKDPRLRPNRGELW